MNAPRKLHVNTDPIPGASYFDNRLFVEGYTMSFGIGYVADGAQARQVMAGPLVPGPWAYVYGQGTVIDNHGGSKRDIDRQRSEGKLVEARIGDTLMIGGHEYRIARLIQWGRPSRDYVDLILIA